ncbi:hypothetical protein LEMLEM_LOCUS19882, partial [Lemmus lemmus]
MMKEWTLLSDERRGLTKTPLQELPKTKEASLSTDYPISLPLDVLKVCFQGVQSVTADCVCIKV